MAIRLVYSREARWVEIGHGAALLCQPPTTQLVYMAKAQATARMTALKEAFDAAAAVGARIEGAPDLSDSEHEDSALEAMFVTALAETVTTDWRNVLGEDGDEPLAFDPGLLPLLLEDEAVATAFLTRYLQPLHEIVAEKKD